MSVLSRWAATTKNSSSLRHEASPGALGVFLGLPVRLSALAVQHAL
jgi:hypothetical protein